MDYFVYLLAGAIAGLLSGLFGVGGGLIIVPILSALFIGMAFPEPYVMHMALGTSLATIIFTSVSSALSHHKNHNVDWRVVRRIAIGIVIGTLLGAALAARMGTLWLQLIFAVFVLGVATQLILDIRPDAKRSLPGVLPTNIVGVLIGSISSLVGIGGGTLSVPFLIYCNVAIKRSIGTSAAIGIPIAIAGSLGFMYQGWSITTLPVHSIGFVYLPALLAIALVSTLTAPLGAKLAQRLPANFLKKAFAILLYLIALKMILAGF